MSRGYPKEKEDALHERADQVMAELERKYVFLRTDMTMSERKGTKKQDAAALEALSEIREKLRA